MEQRRVVEHHYMTNGGLRGPESQTQIIADKCASIIEELRLGRIEEVDASYLLSKAFIFHRLDNMTATEAFLHVSFIVSFLLLYIYNDNLFLLLFHWCFFLCFLSLFGEICFYLFLKNISILEENN